MMKTILVAGVLAATAFAGVASAGPAHCQSGSTPAGFYSVCLLGYTQYHYQFDCTVASCGYDYHYVYDSSDNNPINAFNCSPAGCNSIYVDQNKYSYAYNYDFFGSTGSGDGAGKSTYASICSSAGCVYFSQYSYSYDYAYPGGGGSGSGKSTDVGAGSVGFHQYSYTNSCCGSGGATYIQLGPAQIPIPNAPQVPDVPDFPAPPV